MEQNEEEAGAGRAERMDHATWKSVVLVVVVLELVGQVDISPSFDIMGRKYLYYCISLWASVDLSVLEANDFGVEHQDEF